MIQEEIDSFFEYIRKKVRALAQVEPLDFRKILLCVIIDTLAKAVHPTVKGNRKRFSRLVENFSSWPYWNRVATFQLLYQLEQESLTEGALYIKVSEVTKRHHPYSVIRPDSEPESQTVLSFASSANEQSLVNQGKYIDLFYALRCSLVHEGREPGLAYEFPKDAEPKYMNLTRLDESGKPVDSKELLFPYQFILSVLEDCVEKSHQYFTRLGVDPRASFSFTSVW